MNKLSTLEILDDETPITQADIDAGRLVLRNRAADGRITPSKQQVILDLDVMIIEHFKRIAGESGYQSLINETLKSSVMQSS